MSVLGLSSVWEICPGFCNLLGILENRIGELRVETHPPNGTHNDNVHIGSHTTAYVGRVLARVHCICWDLKKEINKKYVLV